MPVPRAADAKRALRLHRDPERAAQAQRFFRTGPGEYGEGDEFLGLTVPQVRDVARRMRDLPYPAIEDLLDSPKHEDRLLALILLVDRARIASGPERDAVARFYLDHIDRVNQWDLVDVSAPSILGPYFAKRSRAPLHKLARSRSLWRRRVAILTTFHFIRQGEVEETLQLAEKLRDDKHDLIHKAVGWMLREVGKRDRAALETFLDAHAPDMPRTMLRYAIEKMPTNVRRHYMTASRSKRAASPD